MDTNAIITAVVASLAVPGFFGFRAWWAGLLAGALALNYPTHALVLFGIALVLFMAIRLAQRKVAGEKTTGQPENIIDLEQGEDGSWRLPRKSA